MRGESVCRGYPKSDGPFLQSPYKVELGTIGIRKDLPLPKTGLEPTKVFLKRAGNYALGKVPRQCRGV